MCKWACRLHVNGFLISDARLSSLFVKLQNFTKRPNIMATLITQSEASERVEHKPTGDIMDGLHNHGQNRAELTSRPFQKTQTSPASCEYNMVMLFFFCLVSSIMDNSSVLFRIIIRKYATSCRRRVDMQESAQKENVPDNTELASCSCWCEVSANGLYAEDRGTTLTIITSHHTMISMIVGGQSKWM